jgi:pimeloyl-ACP methyl ester carboxylesterase
MLVHGAWHASWCWERLVPELDVLGHRSLTVDLPSDDPAATYETYADVVVDALSEEDEEVILVGHSMAGMTIPLVADRRPVRRLVYLCSLIPMPGRSFLEQLGVEPDTVLPEYEAGMEADEQGTGTWTDREVARRVLYADCEEEVARAAFERLRPQAGTPYLQPCALETFPPTRSTYVVCGDDHLVNPDWSRRQAADRAGAELIEMPGGHSPFLSRPRAVADVLHRLAG